ncbi:MAG: ribonuclease R, partial [Lachnospiraceae bacterium]|nr:ribonuclease R [Lachnospiraceae bacterium]
MERNELENRKKKIYDFICDSLYVPMKVKEMAMVLDIPREKRDELAEVLDALVADGKISVSKRGKYAKAEATLLEGIFTSNLRGFGFVTVDDMDRDIFISVEDCGSAMQDDRVVIQITKPERKNKRAEGKVVKILERGIHTIIGRYEDNGGFGFVISDNPKFTKDVFVSGPNSMDAKANQKVVCDIISYGDEKKNPEGKITEILGDEGTKGVEILSIIRAFNLPEEFSPEVEKNADKVAIDVPEEEIARRLDLRDTMMVTIDGEDAKDLDDAVSLEMNGDEYVLGVHIADVTHYVKEGSPLDLEAKKRGTSVYLVDRVIPMLPRKLSNGICSLNHDENRLALSCIMNIDKNGNVVGHKIAETV